MSERKLLYAQDLIKSPNRNVWGGFNQFINGRKEPIGSDYGDKGQYSAELQGYEFAKEMAKTDGIAFTHVFKCGQNNCYPIMYGGFIACNSCGRSKFEKEWWKIQVEKDGNQYCCHGLDFINLQESDNYAFGDDFEEAIENYGALMREKPPNN